MATATRQVPSLEQADKERATFLDLLQTDRTFATRKNAVAHLEKTAEKLGAKGRILYVIAVNEEGRFAPIVIGSISDNMAFAHNGVTIAS